jgi:hypothetical protein
LLEGVKSVKLKKNEIGFPLEELEQLARQQEETIRRMSLE